MLALIALVCVGAWTQREHFPAWREWSSGLFQRTELEAPAGEPTEELARRAEQKLASLTSGGTVTTVHFSRVEVQSYVDYRLAPDLPPGITDPVVTIGDSTLAVRVQVELDALGQTGSADALRKLLGDSASVEAEFEPEIAAPGVGQVEVLSLRAGAFPIPPLAIPMVLREAGLNTAGGMSRAVTFPVEPTVTSVSVREGSLELTAEPNGD